MKKTVFTVGISIGLFFVGLLGGYLIGEQTYSPKKMMANDPDSTTPWMSAMMDTMMNDPILREQMINQMTENQKFMQEMMQDNQRMNNMMDSDMMNNTMTTSMMSSMEFSTNAPLIMPMIDGYHNGEKVFFVHTEVSEIDMAQMMSKMINFPTLHVSGLKDIPQSQMSKMYVFTNGIAGSGPYGGGPFMFQIDVFDSVPGQTEYSQFRVPYLVTWNDNFKPRILSSVDEILEAEANGELKIQKTENVVNAPMIVWKSNGMEQRASMIQRMFESMSGVDGEVISINVENYFAIFKLHSPNNMGMMNQMMDNPGFMKDMMGMSSDDDSKTIFMGMNNFMPNELSVNANTTITWQTHDMEKHNVVGIFKTDSGNEISILSGDIVHMERWSYTFEESGVFEYFCGYHENEGMKGEIIVS